MSGIRFDPCQACKGWGWLRAGSEKCPSCHGTGKQGWPVEGTPEGTNLVAYPKEQGPKLRRIK